MSATKHTPEPWSVGITEASNGEIEVISASRPYVCMVLPGAIEGVTEANARLIAAAPELLEALKKAREWHLGDKFRYGYGVERMAWQQQLELYDAALARAQGESS